MAEAEKDDGIQSGAKVRPSLDLSKSAEVQSSHLSPKSPSSIFSKTHLEASKGCLVKAILLAQWDNILGPRIRHLWSTEHETSITLPVLNHIASHTLSGEICRDPTAMDIDTKFYVMKERSAVITAFVFGGMGTSDMAVHSLSIVLPHNLLATFLPLYDVTLLWMRRYIAKLRILLDRGPTSVAMATFTRYLNNFMLMLSSLADAGLPQHIPLSDTAFHPDNKLEESFLRKAITSQLMTCGRSVVIGRSISKINLMICTLGLFLTPNERLCSRLAVEGVTWPYHPDLCIQGMVKEAESQLSQSLREVFLSRYPSTLIDVSTLEVRQSSGCGDHALKRHELIREELRCVWAGRKESSVTPYRNLFQPYPDEPETLVRTFLEEVQLLPTVGGVRESFVQQFMRLLDRRAMTLIKYVESETNHGKTTVRQNQKKLRHDLALTLPGDFLQVLSCAEKLRPGSYCAVVGDPGLEADHMHNILNTF